MSTSRTPNMTYDRQVATFEKKRSESVPETNSAGVNRDIHYRARPIHSLAAFRPTRGASQRSQFAHWGIQVGDYVWELEVVNDAVQWHVGVWKVPDKTGPLVFLTADADGEAFDPSTMDSMSCCGKKVGSTNMTDHQIQAIAAEVAEETNQSGSRHTMDRLMQFFSPTHPVRNFKRLFPHWRKKHPYDKVTNNCQHFAKRLAKKLDKSSTITREKTIRIIGLLMRIAFYCSQNMTNIVQLGLPPPPR
ncbi:hypothetical protein MMC10_002400 [Thelotrema lepadinum]|nr:hypothetical protein [Thelotrema lepadinum]